MRAPASGAQTNAASSIPHLAKRGPAAQLIVDGKPFLCWEGNCTIRTLPRMIPIFETAVTTAGTIKGLKITMGSAAGISQVMGWRDQVGSLERGRYADVITVPGDPMADITELQRVKFVMKGGKLIRNEIAQGARK